MSSQPQPSIASRGLLAIALLVGFYALALVFAAGLFFAPIALRPCPFLILFFCWFAAAVVAWSVMPRIDCFKPPGPRLDRDDQPRLFHEIEAVARATGQSTPREVYLLPDVDAFVARRGGIMGLFSRPVLGVGLPLIATLNANELRAVLAHEFGHFHGGDTYVGPWIHQTRSAMIRTVEALDDGRSVFFSLVQWPFRKYGAMFLRVTQAISRQQEVAADELSARIAGGVAAASALRKSECAAEPCANYMKTEYAAAIDSGFRPPIAEGFLIYLAAQKQSVFHEAFELGLRERATHPFDSHPPMYERIAALAAHDAVVPADDTPASSWLAHLPELETRLLSSMIRGKDANELEPLSWNDAGERLWIPRWRAQRERFAPLLAGAKVGQLREDAQRILARVKAATRASIDDSTLRGIIAHLGGALAIALIEHGWNLDFRLGYDFVVSNGGRSLEPFTIAQGAVIGMLDAEAWRRQAAALGIADLDLAPAALDAATAGR